MVRRLVGARSPLEYATPVAMASAPLSSDIDPSDSAHIAQPRTAVVVSSRTPPTRKKARPGTKSASAQWRRRRSHSWAFRTVTSLVAMASSSASRVEVARGESADKGAPALCQSRVKGRYAASRINDKASEYSIALVTIHTSDAAQCHPASESWERA